MSVIRVENCVEDALRRGLRDEAVFQSVMARIHQPGVEADWGQVPVAHHFWYEGMSRDEHGKKLSKRQTDAAINRHLVGCWETHLLERLKAQALDPKVFTEEEETICVPLGTLTALDETNGWDVTLAARIRRKPIDKLLRDLEPILRSLARKARRAFSLEETKEDDLMQEARIKVALGLATYEGRCSFETWAYRVIWRAMVDEGRRLAKERKRERLCADLPEEALSDITLAVDDHLALWPVLKEAFSTVPNSELVFLQMLDYEDGEISDLNIRMKRGRARKKLAERLQIDPEVAAYLSDGGNGVIAPDKPLRTSSGTPQEPF